MSDAHIELTFRLWSTGATQRFDEYVAALTGLLPAIVAKLFATSHRSMPPPVRPMRSSSSASPIESPSMGFSEIQPGNDLEELAGQAVSQSLITDGRTRTEPASPPHCITSPKSEAPDA